MKHLITILLLFSSFNIYAQPSGNALYFNGNYTYAPGDGISTSLSHITLEAWVFHTVVDGSIQRYVTLYPEVAVIRHNGNGQLHFYLKLNGALHSLTVNNALQFGQWYHVAGTWDGLTQKLYLNGKLVALDMPFPLGTYSLNPPNGHINVNDYYETLDGHIDEVRIWNDARTQVEIQANMYRSISSGSGLENYWKFNEDNGNYAYPSVGSVTLGLVGSNFDWVKSGAFSGPRNALDFDGTNDYVEVPDNSSLDITYNLTIEAWIKADSWETEIWRGTIVAKEKSDKTGYNLRCGENGRLSFVNGISGSWPEVQSSEIMLTDIWYHVCGVYDGASQKIYINGELVGENNASGSVGTNDLDLFIGSSPGYSGRLFDGKIEEVRIWNDVRTPAEIRENMCQTLAGNESGLVAYYRFDQEEGTTLYDLTSNDNDGTLTNMADNDWVSSNAFNTWIGWCSNVWTDSFNWSRGIVPNSNTENVGFPAGSGSTFLSGNFTCNNLIIGTGSNLNINSGSTLTISNSILNAGTQSGDGLVKLSGRDSAYELNGIFSNLELDDTDGAMLTDNLTINGTMTLTNGTLSIGDNTLFFNGLVSNSSGSLSGGSSSNITFGGSGASTLLPVVSLGNLTINRANGITLSGDVTIDNTLTLTNGQFAVGSNTLTIKNAIAGTPANLVTTGNSSITITGSGSGVNIPSSVSDLNNMLLDNSNGTILQSDLLIDGTMTLTNGALTTNGYALSYGPNGTLKYNGTSLQTTTSNEFPSTNSPKNLIINNAAGVNLAFNRTIDSTLILTNGDLDLNDDTLTLGVNATLSESVGNTVKGDSGIIITTRTFNAGDLTAGVNIAGLGAEITTDAGLGETTIIRGHAAQTRGTAEGILRYYDISPTNNSGLNGTLTFHYDYTEMNGILSESLLKLFRSTDTGNTWSAEGGAANTVNNTIILSGINAFSRWTAFNTGFTDIVTTLDDVYNGSVAWGDYDNDGDLDILLTGNDGSGRTSRVYRNDGYDNFTDINAGLTGVCWGSVAWGDYDNDGDLDILMTGQDENYDEISRVYRNDGSGIFTDINAGLPGVYHSSVAWGDYDNDGDLDILMTGQDENYDEISRVYRNDGSGIFTDINAGLPGVEFGSAAWGDYDNDGDLDILLTGCNENNDEISRIYRNDGSGTFTDINAGLPGVVHSSAAWGDYDNDGDLDILLTGWNDNNDEISRIYRNDGSGTFTDINAGLPGVYIGGVAWGDYDNDGDLDILLTGWNGFIRISRVYRNDGYCTFTDINAGLIGVSFSSAAWGDYDNDGDLDILLTGSETHYTYNEISRVYRNDIFDSNTAPGTPTNLSASVSNGKVNLSWDKSMDNETPQNALTYNLRIGTSSGGVQTASPMADVSNGYRKVAALGNTNHNNNWEIYGLIDNSTYYWSVQAVDNAFAGSAFATEGSFVIPDYPNISTTSITNITTTTASSGGNVTDEGTFPVTVKGIVWDTCKNPTVDTYTGKTNNGSGLGSFISSLTGLAGGQTYYVRAYATNSEYTAYGGQKVFATPMKPPGNALDFDGIDDYVKIPDNGSLDLTDSLTIEAWIKADLWKANIWEGSIIVKDGDQSGYMLRCGDNGKVNFNIGTGAWNDLTTDEADSLSLNIWYHIAATYDGTTQKIYVNGVLVKEQSTSGAVVVNPYSLMIGKSPAYPDRRYAGKIDEVRIWNIARNSVQIRKNMHRTLNGDEDNLVAYYRFDHISGTALSDRTNNENDGTLYNMDDSDWVTSTAPAPFFTVGNGNWEAESTWATGQNPPVHPWSRVKIKHNNTLNSNMEVIEMIIDTNATMTISTGNTLTVGGE